MPGPVIKGFDPPAKPWLPGSRGVEFSASPGEPVRTVTAGVVVFAGQVAGTGAVSIMLPDGRRTTHMPVVPVVAVGDVVIPGQVIGLVGVGPPCSRTCLHWGLKKGTEYQNPMTLLDTEVRLLPMQGASSGGVGQTGPSPALGASRRETSYEVCRYVDAAMAGSRS